MQFKRLFPIFAIFCLGATAGGAYAQYYSKHPYLNAAQVALHQAFNSITQAQQANDYQLGGHAAKAKELIRQAGLEVNMAVDVSNANHGW